MYLHMLKGNIHKATVIQAELDYISSIIVDEDLLEASGIQAYEKVQIVDMNNGRRFETYTITGKGGSVNKNHTAFYHVLEIRMDIFVFLFFIP